MPSTSSFPPPTRVALGGLNGPRRRRRSPTPLAGGWPGAGSGKTRALPTASPTDRPPRRPPPLLGRSLHKQGGAGVRTDWSDSGQRWRSQFSASYRTLHAPAAGGSCAPHDGSDQGFWSAPSIACLARLLAASDMTSTGPEARWTRQSRSTDGSDARPRLKKVTRAGTGSKRFGQEGCAGVSMPRTRVACPSDGAKAEGACRGGRGLQALPPRPWPQQRLDFRRSALLPVTTCCRARTEWRHLLPAVRTCRGW